MSEGRIAKPLAVYVLLVVGLLLAVSLVGALTGTGATDGQQVQGQSPAQYQPDAVLSEVDPESGTIEVAGADEVGGQKRVLIDTQHDNEFSRTDLGPAVDALFAAGHSVTFAEDTGDGDVDYEESLDEYDALLVIQPTDRFTPEERRAVRNFTDDGGRLVVLAEPPQVEVRGPFGTPRVTVFRATNLTGGYGVRIGAEQLYNTDDDANDNNFRSFYARPADDSRLTNGADAVTYDIGGYVVVQSGSNLTGRLPAAEGTRGLETRRPVTPPTVASGDNVTVVADASFVEPDEVYDADNEVFVGNLLSFMVRGQSPAELNATATPTLTPSPTSTPTPTSTATVTSGGGNSSSMAAPEARAPTG